MQLTIKNDRMNKSHFRFFSFDIIIITNFDRGIFDFIYKKEYSFPNTSQSFLFFKNEFFLVEIVSNNDVFVEC